VFLLFVYKYRFHYYSLFSFDSSHFTDHEFSLVPPENPTLLQVQAVSLIKSLETVHHLFSWLLKRLYMQRIIYNVS
jgi:hypothetical protein